LPSTVKVSFLCLAGPVPKIAPASFLIESVGVFEK